MMCIRVRGRWLELLKHFTIFAKCVYLQVYVNAGNSGKTIALQFGETLFANTDVNVKHTYTVYVHERVH